jgi:transposase-like protein
MLVNIQALIDDAKCYAIVRQLRWPGGVGCPACAGSDIVKRGMHTHQAHRQRDAGRACGRQFDDLTGTIFEGHHHPLRVWVLCLYIMGLNLSNKQIAAELDVDADTLHIMATQLREGVRVF